MNVRELYKLLEAIPEAIRDREVIMVNQNPGEPVRDVVYGWDPILGSVIFLDSED